MLTNFLDLFAVLVLGITAVVATTYVSGLAYPNWLGDILIKLDFLQISPKSLIICLAIFTTVLFISKSFFSIFLLFLFFKFLSSKQLDLSSNLIKALIGSEYSWLRTKNSQELVSIVIRSSNSLFTYVVGPAIIVASEIFLLLALMLSLLIINFFAGIILGSIFLIVWLILALFVNKKITKMGAIYSLSDNESRGLLNSFLESYREINVYKKYNFFLSRILNLKSQNSNSINLGLWLQQLPRYIYETALILGAVSISVFQLINSDLIIGISTSVIFLSSAARILPSVLRIHSNSHLIKFYAKDVQSFDQIWIELNSHLHRDDIESRKTQLLNSPEVQITNLSFAYKDSSRTNINNITFNIPKNSFTVITGPSGAGKSTLIDLLLGIYKPDSGSILLRDKAQLIKPEVAMNLAYVPQNPIIIPGTLIENIAFGVKKIDLDLDSLSQAIELSCLEQVFGKSDIALESSLKTIGTKFSGGEIQRIALARALYSKPKLLLLDEATNALDSKIENSILSDLKLLTKHMTVILVSHKSSSLRYADWICYINDGELKGFGTLNQLMLENSDFASLKQSWEY
jgi:ABC-type multidrug transport system fused ATPase/permease subunit